MAIERDPTRVATSGLAGLLGTTFSPIPPTPTDEQRRVTTQTPAAPSGQIVNIPSFKPTMVTQLPSPLLVTPETVSRQFFREEEEGRFAGGKTALDRILDRIANIIREQVEQFRTEQRGEETSQQVEFTTSPRDQEITTPFEGGLPQPVEALQAPSSVTSLPTSLTLLPPVTTVQAPTPTSPPPRSITPVPPMPPKQPVITPGMNYGYIQLGTTQQPSGQMIGGMGGSGMLYPQVQTPTGTTGEQLSSLSNLLARLR